jgi:hypothetical protein
MDALLTIDAELDNFLKNEIVSKSLLEMMRNELLRDQLSQEFERLQVVAKSFQEICSKMGLIQTDRTGPLNRTDL